MATLSRAKSHERRQYAGLWQLLDILLCGSLAWLGLLLLEIAAGGAEQARLLGRAAYLVGLACRYSAVVRRAVAQPCMPHGLGSCAAGGASTG